MYFPVDITASNLIKHLNLACKEAGFKVVKKENKMFGKDGLRKHVVGCQKSNPLIKGSSKRETDPGSDREKGRLPATTCSATSKMWRNNWFLKMDGADTGSKSMDLRKFPVVSRFVIF